MVTTKDMIAARRRSGMIPTSINQAGIGSTTRDIFVPDPLEALKRKAAARKETPPIRRVLTKDDEREFTVQPMFVKFRMNDPREFDIAVWGGHYLVLDVNHLSEKAREWINSGQLIMDEWDMDVYGETKRELEEIDPFFTPIENEEVISIQRGLSDGDAQFIRDAANAMAARLLSLGFSFAEWKTMTSTEDDEEEIEVRFTIKGRPRSTTFGIVGQISEERKQIYQQHLDQSKTLQKEFSPNHRRI